MSFLPLIKTGCKVVPGYSWTYLPTVGTSALVKTAPGQADVCRTTYLNPRTELMYAIGGVVAIAALYIIMHPKKKPATTTAAPSSKVSP